MAGNGRKLAAAVRAFAGGRDPELARWIEGEARFPDTMVDSITPATTEALRREVREATGFDDAIPVAREAFAAWVIEDVLPPGGPDLAGAGVILTGDVAAHERAKLRILNGAHSTLAYLGLLRGRETVADAMADPWLAATVEAMIGEEIMPVLRGRTDIDLADYSAQTFAALPQPGDRPSPVADRLGRVAEAALSAARHDRRGTGGGLAVRPAGAGGGGLDAVRRAAGAGAGSRSSIRLASGWRRSRAARLRTRRCSTVCSACGRSSPPISPRTPYFATPCAPGSRRCRSLSMPDLDSILAAAPVIPVLVIDRLEEAVPIAEALVEGGLPVLEVTLRTPAALDAIRAMRRCRARSSARARCSIQTQLDAAREAGAQFIVSPGLTDRLAAAAIASGLPFLPGVATASEVMRARDHGFSRLKFFPAMASGGLPALNGLAAIFGEMRFCPTGGITAETARDWLAAPAVACVGGSWLVPARRSPSIGQRSLPGPASPPRCGPPDDSGGPRKRVANDTGFH